MGYLPYQLVQDFVHQQYESISIRLTQLSLANVRLNWNFCCQKKRGNVAQFLLLCCALPLALKMFFHVEDALMGFFCSWHFQGRVEEGYIGYLLALF